MSLFYEFEKTTKIEEITMKWPSDAYMIPAGTPMSRTGIATGSDAVGILASDEHFEFTLPKSLAPATPKEQADYTFAVITDGVINITAVEKSAGVLSDEVKAALSAITFIEETDPAFGGGGASDCDWNIMKNKPFEEVVGEKITLLTDHVQSFDRTKDVNGKTVNVYYVGVCGMDREDPLPTEGTANITINDSSYSCNIKTFGTGETYMLGNGALFDSLYEDTGEPYCVIVSAINNPQMLDFTVYSTESPVEIILPNGNVGNGITFSVEVDTGNIKTLDPKFLPVGYIKQLIKDVMGTTE